MRAKNYGLFLGILLLVCSVEGMQLQVDRVDGPAGAEDIAVHLTAADAQGLAGADLEIHYDADLLAVGDIETGNLSSGWMLATNRRTGSIGCAAPTDATPTWCGSRPRAICRPSRDRSRTMKAT